jgi:hypothetical protein
VNHYGLFFFFSAIVPLVVIWASLPGPGSAYRAISTSDQRFQVVVIRAQVYGEARVES